MKGELLAARPPKSDEEVVGDALEREREALLKLQRMRFWLAVAAAGGVGFTLGAFTTYQIACSLRPRR